MHLLFKVCMFLLTFWFRQCFVYCEMCMFEVCENLLQCTREYNDVLDYFIQNSLVATGCGSV